ncbi:MAG TPA: hypothetical protein VH274_06220 [Mycobacteriales bacterium]|nr:hypothetical protein [Mycobacteriales bacterium]
MDSEGQFFVTLPEQAVARQDAPPVPLPVSYQHSRWRSSVTSFGPIGRIVMTVLMFVPMWFFWETQGFAWPGLVIWGVFILPWALRDIWRRARIHAN